MPQLPSRSENCDHVAADNAVILGQARQSLRQVSERDVAKVVSD
jgi:hypothetical protein